MRGWGLLSLSMTAGICVAAGCGGRTGALDDEYADPQVPGQAGSGASSSGRGGSGPGGSWTGGTVGTGGAAPIPVGGSGYGGSPYGGYAGYPDPGYGGYPSYGGYPGYGGYPSYGGYPGAGGPPIDCQVCLWSRCNAQLSQCYADAGCLSIFACMQATGCDAFACYDARTCGGIIDQWGGPSGVAMSLLLKAAACSLQSCACYLE